VGFFLNLCEGYPLKDQFQEEGVKPPPTMNQPLLYCKYSRGLGKPDPYFHVGPLKVELLSLDPEILFIHELLYEGELLQLVLDSVHQARFS
jgi:hypothetical protein